MSRQFSHTANLSVYVFSDREDRPTREQFLKALHQTVALFENNDNYYQEYVKWGSVMTREHDFDVWVH